MVFYKGPVGGVQKSPKCQFFVKKRIFKNIKYPDLFVFVSLEASFSLEMEASKISKSIIVLKYRPFSKPSNIQHLVPHHIHVEVRVLKTWGPQWVGEVSWTDNNINKPLFFVGVLRSTDLFYELLNPTQNTKKITHELTAKRPCTGR